MRENGRYHGDVFDTFKEISEKFGEDISKGVMSIISRRHGGTRINIPTPEDVWREERNLRIRLEFRGNNHEELGMKYKNPDGTALSVSQVRRIVQEG
jgi:Mor family transcriptional regulator